MNNNSPQNNPNPGKNNKYIQLGKLIGGAIGSAVAIAGSLAGIGSLNLDCNEKDHSDALFCKPFISQKPSPSSQSPQEPVLPKPTPSEPTIEHSPLSPSSETDSIFLRPHTSQQKHNSPPSSSETDSIFLRPHST